MFHFKKEMRVGSKKVGAGHPVYLVAEIGRNHNGDLKLAKKTIDAAVEAGADSVKFQSFKARDLLVRNLSDIKHVAETGQGKSLYQLSEEVELSEEHHRELGRYAREKGIDFFSTPLDPSFVALLEEIDVPLYKIASLDIRYIDLIRKIAETKKPVFISTGMSYLGEVEKALLALRDAGAEEVVVLQCTSNYPPADNDINLRAMKTMADAFNVNVGFSDHSFGIGASIAAVALGAVVIERHFTLDKDLPGTDHRISLTPKEFALMAKEIRVVEKALGSAQKQPAPAEIEMRRIVGRRLVANADIAAGTILCRKDIGCKCSENGLDPSEISSLIGKRLKIDLLRDNPLTYDVLE